MIPAKQVFRAYDSSPPVVDSDFLFCPKCGHELDRTTTGPSKNPLGGQWCLPGGFIEYEEDFLSAAIREVKEETGLNVEIQSILSVVSNFLAANLHTLVVVLEATVTAGQANAGDDIIELGWYSPADDLPTMAFGADRHIIERYWQTKLKGVPVDPAFAVS